jgi:hypothetical protein
MAALLLALDLAGETHASHSLGSGARILECLEDSLIVHNMCISCPICLTRVRVLHILPVPHLCGLESHCLSLVD